MNIKMIQMAIVILVEVSPLSYLEDMYRDSGDVIGSSQLTAPSTLPRSSRLEKNCFHMNHHLNSHYMHYIKYAIPLVQPS